MKRVERSEFTEAQKRALRLIGTSAENVMLFGGAGSGKTFLLVSYICEAAHYFPGLRVAILRKQLKDVRESVMMATFPAVMSGLFGKKAWEINARINRADMCYRAVNGSEIWFGGLDDAQRLDNILGKEYGIIYFNECSQIGYQAYQTAIGRLRQSVEPVNGRRFRQKALFDCNPPSKSHWVYRVFVEKMNPNGVPLKNPEDYVAERLNPCDNAANLPPGYIEKRLATMTGKEYQRFYLGEWTDDAENALWKRDWIDRGRVVDVPECDEILIGVDPAVTSGESSDLTGIVVAGVRENDFFVLRDVSGKYTPEEWGARVCRLYEEFGANGVVAEVNQGGDLVSEVLRNAVSGLGIAALPVRTVRARNGKRTRAEPVAVLYEQGRVHHVGEFRELEEEMTAWTGDSGQKSPDRMDALVWAVTALSAGRVGTVTGGRFWIS